MLLVSLFRLFYRHSIPLRVTFHHLLGRVVKLVYLFRDFVIIMPFYKNLLGLNYHGVETSFYKFRKLLFPTLHSFALISTDIELRVINLCIYKYASVFLSTKKNLNISKRIKFYEMSRVCVHRLFLSNYIEITFPSFKFVTVDGDSLIKV